MAKVTNHNFPYPAWKIAIGSLSTSALAAGSTSLHFIPALTSSPLSAHLVACSLTIFMLILEALAAEIAEVAVVVVAAADVVAASLYRSLPCRGVCSRRAANAVLNLDGSNSRAAIIRRPNKE